MGLARCSLVMCPKVICSGWLIKSFSSSRDWSDWLLLCPWSIFGKLALKRRTRLLKDAPLREDSLLWCKLLSNKPTQVHLQHQRETSFVCLFSCYLVKVVWLWVRFSMMLWYASVTFSQFTFIAFVLILWHETSMKWEIKAVAERQQCLFSCLPHYILVELSLILIYTCYTGVTFIHAFFLCSPLFGFLFQAVSLLYCSCVHNSTAVIFMKDFSQTN